MQQFRVRLAGELYLGRVSLFLMHVDAADQFAVREAQSRRILFEFQQRFVKVRRQDEPLLRRLLH